MDQPVPFRQIFWQTWRDLVFVHWAVDPAVVAALLQAGARVDAADADRMTALLLAALAHGAA